jgi:autotransporter-associated beta strand protein
MKSSAMKFIPACLPVLLAILLPPGVFADLAGPYTPDANTLVLLHFDEAAGGSAAVNAGSLGGSFYTVNEASASSTPAAVTTMLGGAGFVSGATNFNSCLTNPTAGYLAGYDYNKSGAYQGDVSASLPSADALTMSKLNIGNGGQTPFTLEALVQFRTALDGSNHEIICTDSSGAPTGGATNRGFQFRISGSVLNFQFIGGPAAQSVSGTIPTSGADAFAAGVWFHVAMVYDGSIGTLYWTRLSPTVGAAHYLNSASLAIGAACGLVSGPLTIGNENKAAAGEQFLGCIDEVRISSVARAANQMQFYSQAVTITQDPASQNVDYNQPATLSANAASLLPLGYQWYFNSNAITAATNTSFTLNHVAAGAAGYYHVIVTNTAGYAATSSPALLVVGAANFLTHRYSFSADTSDSVGGAWGTNFGNATVAGGALVLDGASGTYMQLPANLFTASNASALTVEFWATLGANANNARVFGFGNTISGTARNYLMFTPHNSGGHELVISAGDSTFQQQVTNAGMLDNLATHVVCVMDPPNRTLSIYTNGVLEVANTNMTVGVGSLNDTLSYVGKSLNTADPALGGTVDEFRIYGGALSPISVQQSQNQGPNTVLADGPAKFITVPTNTTLPEGRVATFEASATGYLPLSYQWFKNGMLVPGATNPTYSVNTTLGENGATLLCYVSNTVGVTTYVTNTGSIMLTVFSPPAVAWLGANNGGANNDWDFGSLNWSGGGGVAAFAQDDVATLDSRGGGSTPINLTQAVAPYNLIVSGDSDYVLTSSSGNGGLVGEGGLTKSGSATLVLDVTNAMAGPVTVLGGVLQVGNSDSAGTLGSGAVTNHATLAFNRADAALSVPAAIHGSGTVRYDGVGAVTISGNSDYSGSTLINAGVVRLASASGLGDSAGATTVASGAQLYITGGGVMAEPLSISGNGDGNGALRKGGADATLHTGGVQLAADATIGVDSGATLVLSNTITGSAALSMMGNGTLTLAASNTYSGGTILAGSSTASACIINVMDSHALGTGPASMPAGTSSGRFIIGSGLTVTNAFQFGSVNPGALLGLLMVNDNTNDLVTTLSGPVEFDSSPITGGCFVGPATSGYLHITGPISSPSTGVVSARQGRMRFSGGGSYSLLTLNAGTLSIGANDGVSTLATLNMAASGPATFDLNGFSQTLAGLADAAAFAELITNSASATSTLTLNLSGSATYSGMLAGRLALVVNGSGTLLLSGSNSYGGNTTVNGGTLELANPSLASGSTVSIASGAMLQMDGEVTNTVAGLVLSGVSQPAGLYSSTTSPSYLAGPGGLLVMPVAANPTNIVSRLDGGKLVLSWPADHKGWRLQAQTNSPSVGLGTNWVDVPNTAGLTSVTNTINPKDGAVFYRLVYP